MRIVSGGVLAGVVALAAAGSVAAQAATPHFRARIIGNSARGTVPKHHFVVGDGYSGLFRDNRHARTRYRVCWHRGSLRGRCKTGRTGAAGVDDSVFLIAPQFPARYVYRWTVRGKVVAHWRVTIGIGD